MSHAAITNFVGTLLEYLIKTLLCKSIWSILLLAVVKCGGLKHITFFSWFCFFQYYWFIVLDCIFCDHQIHTFSYKGIELLSKDLIGKTLELADKSICRTMSGGKFINIISINSTEWWGIIPVGIIILMQFKF